MVDAVEQKRQAVESDRARVLTALSQFSDEEGRVRKTLSSVKQAQIRALKGLLLRQSPFFWGPRTGLGTEWIDRSGESLSSQLKASTAFSKRLPSAFLIQAVLIVVIAVALQSMRRGVQKLAKEKPELQRALPILDLPVSTAFVLSVLISPSLLPQAPRLIQVILATLALIPSVVILRRLLDRRLSPILYALVIMFFVDQLRILAASLPELARLLFLAQMLGGLLFLLWLLRSQSSADRGRRNERSLFESDSSDCQDRADLPVHGFPRKCFRLCRFGQPSRHALSQEHLYCSSPLRRAYGFFEGLLIIALEVRPLNSLRVIRLHRPMFQMRIGRTLEFLAVLLWLDVMLGFFGLLNPLDRRNPLGAERKHHNRLTCSSPWEESLRSLIAIGHLFDLPLPAFCAGGGCLSPFPSRTRHSLRNFNDASLCDPACGIFHRFGSARNRFDKDYDPGGRFQCRDRIRTTECN